VREKDLKFLKFTSIILFLFFWHLVASLKLLELPTPARTAETFFRLITVGEPVLGRTLQSHVISSLGRVIRGSFLAFSTAIPLGIAMARSRRFEALTSTIIELFRPIPPLAWIPLAYIFFRHLENTSFYAQIFIVFVGAFFPAVLNTVTGVKSVEPILIDAARTFGASRLQILTKVIIPASLPMIITGVRVGLGVGWMSIIAAEMIGGSASGIGFFIWTMYYIGGDVAKIISGMIAIGIVGYLMNEGLLWIERRRRY